MSKTDGRTFGTVGKMCGTDGKIGSIAGTLEMAGGRRGESIEGVVPVRNGVQAGDPEGAIEAQVEEFVGVAGTEVVAVADDRADDLDRVRLAQEGDLRAYEQLVQRHERRAYGLALCLMGNREDAEDMLQESFFRAYQALRGFRADSSFQTWFFRILINRCRSERRKRSWERWFAQEGEELLEEEVITKTTPREEASLTELSKKIEEAIQTLPLKQRLVFTMRATEGMKLAEIGEVLHLQLGTVKAHLFRATQKMQRSLDGYLGGES